MELDTLGYHTCNLGPCNKESAEMKEKVSTIQLPKSSLEKLRKLAKKDRRSMTVYLQILIDREFEK